MFGVSKYLKTINIYLKPAPTVIILILVFYVFERPEVVYVAGRNMWPHICLKVKQTHYRYLDRC